MEDEEDHSNDVAVTLNPLIEKGWDLNTVKTHMQEYCTILSNWKEEGVKLNRPRKSVVKDFKDCITFVYGFSDELATYFLQLFSPSEALEFFESTTKSRPLTIRTNTLKTKRRDLAQTLISRGANVDPIGDWSKIGLVVNDHTIPIGATPEYLAGHYMQQSAASLIPVMALEPMPDEKILDMSAAPGGKCTHIGQLMNNTGILYANDINKERCTSLVANIHRIGLTNTIVINYDARDLIKVLPKMDRVLLDAPCTGLGVISKDPSIKAKRTIKDIIQMSQLQKQLLCTAVDLCDANSKKGGIIVYSTCSISVEENEMVIDYILKNRCVELCPLTHDIGVPGYSIFMDKIMHSSIEKYTRRFYPHLHDLEGFFVAKLKKTSNEIPQRTKRDRSKVSPKIQIKTDSIMDFDNNEFKSNKQHRFNSN